MSKWPDVDDERLTATLLRVGLNEGRHLAAREYPAVVNHLLRSASAACLLDREDEALALIARAGQRMAEWTEMAGSGLKVPGFGDLAATRGLLVLAFAPDEARRTAEEFLALTEGLPPGPVHNARLAAAMVVGDAAALQAAARGCELSDAGLGLPWKRLALAVDAGDAVAAGRAASMWLREKAEATTTNEWGAYNEVPIEVSAALGLAALRGVPVLLASDRVLTRFRA